MKRSREPEEDSDPPSPYSADTRVSGTFEDTGGPAPKIVELDPSSTAPEQRSSVEMRCSLPPHKEVVVFRTYDEFESHYSKDHSHRCLECHKNFPSGHLLNLHHEECHDPLLALKREKGEHTVSPANLRIFFPIINELTIGHSSPVSWRDARGSAGRHRSDECIS